MHIFFSLHTLYYLLLTDFKIFKRTIIDKLIDLVIWIVTVVTVTAYLMPAFGLSKEYTGFMVASLIASAGLFELYSAVTNLISDFEGNNTIAYYLTLPIPSWLVFVRSMTYYAFNTIVLGIIVLPMSKLCTWNAFDLSQFNIIKFMSIYVLMNIFYAGFTLWVASKISGIEQIGSVWMRFVYPLWYLGGFQFSWLVLKNFSPFLAYINLLNPMTYIMEGSRAAILGQEGSLNIWACCIALFILSILISTHGIYRLKKRLDF